MCNRLLLGLFAFAITGAMFMARPVLAVPAALPIPQWHKIDIKAAAWEGKGEFAVEVEITAPIVPLHDLAVRMHWPKGFEATETEATETQLAAGRHWTKRFVAKAPEIFDGLLDVEIAARPDPAALEAVVSRIATLSPELRALTLAEVKQFKTPVALGRALSMHIDVGVAALLPQELLFMPIWPLDHGVLFLWVPAAISGNSGLSTRLSDLVVAASTQDSSAALAAIGEMEHELATATEPIPIKTLNQGSLNLDAARVRELLAIDRMTLFAIKSPAALAELTMFAIAHPGSVGAPFAWANVGMLHNRAGAAAEATKAFQRALDLQPAWPRVRRLLESPAATTHGGSK